MAGKPRRLNPNRSLSLDVFRGITIAGMILVNNGGKTSYAPLRHADWHGLTPTDLVFPFFIFIMGVAITFSLSGRAQGEDGAKTAMHIIRRGVLLFIFGLLGNLDFSYGSFSGILAHIRFMGVLQRLGIVYIMAAFIAMHTGPRGKMWTAAALLSLYWALMKLAPVPGFGPGDLSREGNFAAWLDVAIMSSNHLYQPGWDPEGLLSSIPAVATCLIGCIAGHYLKENKPLTEKMSGIFVAGCILAAAGLALSPLFPLNKKLWSPTYTLLTAGLALCFLGVCAWLTDFKGWKRWPAAFVALGANSLIAYMGSGLMMLFMHIIPVGGMELREFIFSNVFASWLNPYNASLGFALSYVFLWMGIAAALYRKRIFIKL